MLPSGLLDAFGAFWALELLAPLTANNENRQRAIAVELRWVRSIMAVLVAFCVGSVCNISKKGQSERANK